MARPSLLAHARPRGDRVLILIDPAPEKSSGGIILAEDRGLVNPPCTGTVVAVGPGVPQGEHVVGRLEPGDRVVFNRYAGMTADEPGDFSPDADRYILVPEGEVAAHLPEPGG